MTRWEAAAFRPLELFSKHVAHRVWDRRESRARLRELAHLEKLQREPLERKRARQWDRLRELVIYAHKKCEFYHWRSRGVPWLRSPEDFRRLPILTKEDVRRNKDRLISGDFGRAGLVAAKTGGSTGVSLQVYCDAACREKRNAAAILCDRWAGWDLGRARGALWGNPPARDTFKKRWRNILLDRLLYLDTVEMTEEAMAAFLRDARDSGVRFLYGHAHSLYILARYFESAPLPGLRIEGIISTSMSLLPPEREVIERAFACRVTDRYGCEEVGLIACECEEARGLHVNADHLFVEFLKPDGRPAGPGEEGRIVVTDLMNRGMPMLRYEVGDMAVTSDRSCPCGRSWPLIERVTGRTADFLVRADGSLAAGVSLVERTLTAIPGLAQLQIVQDVPGAVRLNVVPDDQYGPAAEKRLVQEIKRVLGPEMRVAVNRRPRLDQERNGKYRFAICRVPSAYQPMSGAASKPKQAVTP
jgi:phenylacetate-CoA ligase